MKKRQRSVLESFENNAVERVLALDSADLLVLRGHGVLEAALFSLLAARLAIESDELPTLNFETLARLSLSGTPFNSLLGAALQLNKLRNLVAHEIEPADVETRMLEFAALVLSSLGSEFQAKPTALDAFRAALMVMMYTLMRLSVGVIEVRHSATPVEVERD
ncbi:MAG TPA: hypothetical protein VMU84_12665 [Thermoanaerobaculia bacterium]|nr:hypothetical protein [Thermoanaerobaculia bacterium]